MLPSDSLRVDLHSRYAARTDNIDHSEIFQLEVATTQTITTMRCERVVPAV
jgi:hypothetical protein